MSDARQPVQKPGQRVEVIECEAVPLEKPRAKARPQPRRSFNLLWLIPILLIVFVVFKVLAIAAIAVLILFALPRMLPGGFSGLLRALLPGNGGNDRGRR